MLGKVGVELAPEIILGLIDPARKYYSMESSCKGLRPTKKIKEGKKKKLTMEPVVPGFKICVGQCC